MRAPRWTKVLLIACSVIVTLCMLTQGVYAAETGTDSVHTDQEAAAPQETDPEETLPGETEPEDDTADEILNEVTALPERIADGVVDAILGAIDIFSDAIMNNTTRWFYMGLLTAAETVFSYITSSTANIFNYPWFQVIVKLFSRFGMLLFAVGVVTAFVDIGIEYRRRGADISGAMLNLGKGMMAVGLFAVVPVPLYNFCANIQSVIMRTLAINWSFQNIIDAILAMMLDDLMVVIMLVIMIVLMLGIYLDSLKRGGILLVQICIGSLHMISVPRGYMDNFYGWCKQVIGLCLTVLLQNLVMFCGLMIAPTNLFLGIGTMFAAKEVPRICAQFGMDTSAKTSFSNIAMGANASIQAIKAIATFI